MQTTEVRDMRPVSALFPTRAEETVKNERALFGLELILNRTNGPWKLVGSARNEPATLK